MSGLATLVAAALEPADLDALMADMAQDDEAANTTRSVEDEAAGMEVVAQDAEEFGDNAKAHGWHGWAGSMARRFRRFLVSHGERLGYDEEAGPTLDVVRRFMDWCLAGYARLNFSCVGRKADADAYYALHLPYTLAQRCFPMLELGGWVGLERLELKAKAEPFKAEILAYWKRLKESRDDVEALGRSLQKTKWDDRFYFMAQDFVYEQVERRPNWAALHLALMGFVRTTCNRSGAMGKDWYDRAGLTRLWLGRNVLSVGDFMFDTQLFEITVPVPQGASASAAEAARRLDGESGGASGASGGGDATTDDAGDAEESALTQIVEQVLRGEVDVQRIKKHYHELYMYCSSMTADTVEAARRAVNLMLVYLWRRGVFAVQYLGMSDEAVLEAMRARAHGYAGGMPAGALISSNEAWRRWWAGERGYLAPVADAQLRAVRAAALAEAQSALCIVGAAATPVEELRARQRALKAAMALPEAHDVRREPLFVEVASSGRFGAAEMRAEQIGKGFAAIHDALGGRPFGGGLNSVRRNGIVGLREGCERAGRDLNNVKKAVNHHGASGTQVIDVFYDDSTASLDLGALLMQREMQSMESLKCLAVARLPELAQVRVFEDVALGDDVRVLVYEKDPQRLQLLELVGKARERLERLDELVAHEAAVVGAPPGEARVAAAAARSPGAVGVAGAAGAAGAVGPQRDVAGGASEPAEPQSAAKLTAARQRQADSLAALTRRLRLLEGRLRHATVVTKRWELYESHMATFDSLDEATLRARAVVVDRRGVELASMVAQFSSPGPDRRVPPYVSAARRASRAAAATPEAQEARRVARRDAAKRLRPTESGGAGAATAAKRPRRGRLVEARVCMGEGGRVQLRLQPTVDRRVMAALAAPGSAAAFSSVRLRLRGSERALDGAGIAHVRNRAERAARVRI